MRALTVTGPGSLELVEQESGVPGPGEALVAVRDTGICGTDLKILDGSLPVQYPIVLGHEIIGQVVDSGSESMVAGTRVLVNPATWCGRCTQCRAGRTNLCESSGRMGIDIPGGAAAHLVVPVERLVRLPDSVPDESAVLLQVLGTCLHAQRLVQAFPGQRAAVVGLGVGGIMHVQLMRARGLDVTAIGRSPAKLALAREAGASLTVSAVDAGRATTTSGDGARYDLVVEAAGAPESLALAASLVAPGGSLLVFGIHGEAGSLPFQRLYEREVLVVNARGATAQDYEDTVALAATGRIDLDLIPVRRFPLAEAHAALGAARAATDVAKVALEL